MRERDRQDVPPTAVHHEQPLSVQTADVAPFSPGIVIAGKFALRKRVASGAMGSVFEAWDMFVERKVALKLMHPHLARRTELVTRFRREAQAAARIQHPNVVAVHEVGKRRDGSFYIVHELLSGRTLREHLQQSGGRLSPEQALAIAIPIAGGLSAAHACGIVHRDVKPENIVLCHAPNGELVPKIIDFGIAKVNDAETLTDTGVVVGTPQYMSPEQAGGDPVDAQSDVWALGVVLFELIVGALPFDGKSMEAVLYKILNDAPPRMETLVPKVSPLLAAAIHRAIERDPEERTRDMMSLRAELTRAEVATRHAALAEEPTAIGGLTVHAAIPRENIVLNSFAGEQEPPTVRRASSPPEHDIQDADTVQRYETDKPEWEWQDITQDKGPKGLNFVEEAARALGVNALRDAVRWASLALERQSRGSALIIAAIADYWLGEHVDSLRFAERALCDTKRGGAAWHAAFGHVVLASGELGREDRLTLAVTELERAFDEDAPLDPYIISSCRLAVQACRVGRLPVARRLYKDATQRAEHSSPGLACRAWLAIASSVLASESGDLAAGFRFAHSAGEHFTSISDVRSACLARATAGYALLRLGAFPLAEVTLEETLATAGPMQLYFVSAARLHRARALAAMGRGKQAIADIESVLEERRSRNDHRAVAAAIVHLLEIQGPERDLDRAFALVEEAERLIPESSHLRARILARMAEILLSRGSPEIALTFAGAAVDIVTKLGGMDEGEPFVRTVHALTLARSGHLTTAQRWIADARTSLLSKARMIGDPQLRHTFLHSVPDHAKLLRCAEQGFGPA